MKPVGPAESILAGKLTDLVDDGIVPPCALDPEHWFAETVDDRKDAAAQCSDCPVFAECEAAADEMRARWGVWAGRDRTPRPRTAVER